MNIDKILKYFYKKIKISLFRIIYPNITNFIRAEQNKKIFIKKISFKKNFIYRLFSFPNGRLFSNSVHDTAVIFDDKIVRDVSYQYRYKKNVHKLISFVKINFFDLLSYSMRDHKLPRKLLVAYPQPSIPHTLSLFLLFYFFHLSPLIID